MADPEVTVGLKTFLRPDKLRTCLEHVRRLTPGPERIVVSDDSPRKDLNREVYESFEGDLPLHVIDLESDAGISVGRNRILELTDTDYLFIVDDDHYVPEGALEIAQVLEADPSLGGVAASWMEYGRFRMGAADISVNDGWVIVDAPCDKPSRRAADLAYFTYDFIPSSALFRTAALRDYRWDEAYVIDGEHVDFYYGHKQTTDWKFAVTPDVRVEHDPGPGRLTEYSDHRMSDAKRRASRAYFAEKWDVNGYLIKEYHGTAYPGRLQRLAARSLYALPPRVHWHLKQRGHLDRMKATIERVTGVPVE